MVALGVIFLILSVVVIYLGGKLDVSWDVWSCTIGTVSLIIACIVLCVSICIYIDSMFTVADVHSFYEVNRDNYAVTITETKEAMLQVRANGGVNIPLENMQQSTNWSARISEY